jgi:hypothetical protein
VHGLSNTQTSQFTMMLLLPRMFVPASTLVLLIGKISTSLPDDSGISITHLRPVVSRSVFGPTQPPSV